MAFYFVLIFSLLTGIYGGYLFVWQLLKLLNPIVNDDAKSNDNPVRMSALLGISIFLCFFALELFMANFDAHYHWTIESVLVMLAIALAGGIIIFLGSMWRFFIFRKMSGFIKKKYSKGSNDK